MQKVFVGLLAFIPISIGASMFGFSPVIAFVCSILAIIPLAKFIGEATESIAEASDPVVGGLVNATFGNATELVVGFLALREGLLDVVRATIAGSIIGNLLLALGAAMFIGGMRHKQQTFNKTGVSAFATTLVLSSIALIVPALLAQTIPTINQPALVSLSGAVSVILIISYFGSLYFSLKTHRHLYISDIEERNPRWNMRTSMLVLGASMLAVAWVSDILVGSITPVVSSLGWTPVFVSAVLVAIAGNVAEHTSAVTAAIKNRMDLSIQISMGSAVQIAQFVGPALVLASFVLGNPLNLVFSTYEIIAIIVATIIANFVVLDGESNWLEGFQLIAAYAIIAAGFFFA